MAKQFLCGGEKYTLAGPKADTISLPVLLSNLPTQIEVEGYVLGLKTTFHVTLVPVGKVIEKHGVREENFLQKIEADFCEFVQSSPIEFVGYRDEYRFMAEDEKRAVAVMCNVSNLDKFYEIINKKYNLNVECPPTHATLYTLQPNVGIFMVDSSDKERLTKTIPAPIKL